MLFVALMILFNKRPFQASAHPKAFVFKYAPTVINCSNWNDACEFTLCNNRSRWHYIFFWNNVMLQQGHDQHLANWSKLNWFLLLDLPQKLPLCERETQFSNEVLWCYIDEVLYIYKISLNRIGASNSPCCSSLQTRVLTNMDFSFFPKSLDLAMMASSEQFK